jgi:transposase
MTRPEIELPDDVEALKAMVLAMAAKAARVEALEKQVDDLAGCCKTLWLLG